MTAVEQGAMRLTEVVAVPERAVMSVPDGNTNISNPLLEKAFDATRPLSEEVEDFHTNKLTTPHENSTHRAAEISQTVWNVNSIISWSTSDTYMEFKNTYFGYGLPSEYEERCVFPNRILPSREGNSIFCHRKAELDRIANYLSPKDEKSFRSYTIYGRRGIGKTEIALHFAHTNPCSFDAIFWIECETSVTIRQCFTRVAVALRLPDADSNGHHEENLLKVHEWLKKTKKRWLLIFDNAERDQVLQQYWPVGAPGAILVTTRKYYNFTKDVIRKGDTIRQFDLNQSWDLLIQLLGDDWGKMEAEEGIPPAEKEAAKALLERLGGLPLAIHEAAHLIKNPDIGHSTITKTLATFNERVQSLPERHSSPRSATEKSLDALWDMIFTSLAPNARALLGVLAWLSPDSIQTQLFVPQTQATLDGSLSFCKEEIIDVHQHLTHAINEPSLAFRKAIQQLLDLDLVKQEAPKLYAVHRIVQEALNFHDVDELQDRFEIASRLVFDKFPSRRRDESLRNRWVTCQDYISHGVHLSRKFKDYAPSGAIHGPPEFVELLSNCAWYLYELGDYEISSRILSTATSACDDKTSLIYAELRNTAGAAYFELNLLSDCRMAWEECIAIRTKQLPHDDPGIASIYHNLGNLALAQGKTEEAIERLNRATQIWLDGGEATASQLALTYLCVGRVRMLQGSLSVALELTERSGDLFIRTTGREKGFMANVHYAFGNIHTLQNDLATAWQDYDACLKICLQTMPSHPITAAAYYSIGRIEILMGNTDSAKIFLEKAKAIAEFRSPTRDDGPIARILRQTAVVLESDPESSSYEEAKQLRERAEVARKKLIAIGEGGFVPRINSQDSERNDEKYDYDSLVPLFFR